MATNPADLISLQRPGPDDDPAESIGDLQNAVRNLVEELFRIQPRLGGRRFSVALEAATEVGYTHSLEVTPNRWALVDLEGPAVVYREPTGNAWTSTQFFLTSTVTTNAIVEVWRED